MMLNSVPRFAAPWRGFGKTLKKFLTERIRPPRLRFKKARAAGRK